MTVVQAIAVVMATVEFAKKALPKLKIQDGLAVGLVVAAALGVTGYKALAESLPLTADLLTFAIQVVVGSMSAYGLLKGGRAKTE